MEALETIVLVGVVIIIGSILAPRLRIPAPLVMLLLGIAVGFIPRLQEIELSSEAVLLLFLPAILFWESLTTSLREIRRDIVGIVLLSTLLVVATAMGVAGIATVLGISWGAALILGAALAPTDATAVGAVAQSLPHRNMTILRAESLMNDGTALVIFSIAIGVGIDQVDYTGWQITGQVALAYFGGGAIGALFGWAGTSLVRRVREPVANNAVLVLLPFAAFLVAELIEASGVVAVVVTGLVLSQSGPRVRTPQARQQTFAFWSLTSFFLNSALFVLVGIEVHVAVDSVSADSIGGLLVLTVLAWLAVLAIRFGFQYVAILLIKAVDRSPSLGSRQMSHRARVVTTTAGFRGAVSLAVALAVPTVLASGEPFPGRDEIVFVTAGVVLLTLLVQGLLLPAIVRWADFEPDSGLDDELAQAEEQAAIDALDHLDEEAGKLGTNDDVRDQVTTLVEDHRALVDTTQDVEENDRLREDDRQSVELRLALLERKRSVMIALRDDGTISDTTLRTMQARLDREALRLGEPEPLE